MADFSKQWCELHNPEMSYSQFDFDILEIADGLDPNHYMPIICEGFGFVAIGKASNGNIILAVPTGEVMTDENGQSFDNIIWEPYEDVIK